MKILALSDHYPPYYKGDTDSIKSNADGLSKGHDVSVLTGMYGEWQKRNGKILRPLNYLEIGHRAI
jgi:hypothetical protein